MRFGLAIKLCQFAFLCLFEATAAEKKVYVIPIREDISTPLTYLVRRGVKQAIEAKAVEVAGQGNVTNEIHVAPGKHSGNNHD